MELATLAGNSRVKGQLSHIQRGEALSHAYLISGPAGSGRHLVAQELAAAALCTGNGGKLPCGDCPHCKKMTTGIHPDFMKIGDEDSGKPISVGEVRQLRTDSYVRPNEGDRKVYFLGRADQMNDSAQNALLKLLEDGPPYAMFLLLAENGTALLPTIRSRCEGVELVPPVVSPAELTEQGSTIVQAIAQRDELGLFRATMPLEKMSRGDLEQLFDGISAHLVGEIARGNNPKEFMAATKLLGTLRSALPRNANPGQLAGWLCGGIFSPDL